MTSDTQQVAAHDQAETHHYVVHFPPHPARASDPHYVDFDHYHRTHRATARCYVGERVGFGACLDAQGRPCPPPAGGGAQPGLELHHAHVEFSLQNGIDLAALEHDFPGISDTTNVGAWVESDANFRWLCCLPDTPVLMADGSHLAIQEVRPGHRVIGHDGRPHLVTAAGSRRYSGRVYRWGDCAITAGHEVLTEGGWLPARQVVDQLRVMKVQVLGLGTAEFEVLDPVIRPIAVDVVDALGSKQLPAEVSLHDESVFHDLPRSVPYSHVSPGCEVEGSVPFVPSGTIVERRQPALIGTEVTLTVTPKRCEGDPAVFAAGIRGSAESSSARLTSDGIWVGREWRPAVDALTSGTHMTTLHRGQVFDLSVEGSHSFFAGGIAVHNCCFHHRGPGGAHTASHSDYEASLYVPGLIAAPDRKGTV